MNLRGLKLPAERLRGRREGPGRVREWAEALADQAPQEAGRSLEERLVEFNGADFPPERRLQLLHALRPAVARTSDLLRAALIASPPPLNMQQQAAASLVQRLWTACAEGYARCARALARRQTRPMTRLLLAEACYHAIDASAERLLTSYVHYAPEPSGAWGEIHELFRLAESAHLQSEPVDTEAAGASPGPRTVDTAYKRIVLLAIAGPYHLMAGEAPAVFALAERWGAACQMLHCGALDASGRFVVDLTGDGPPFFVAEDGADPPHDTRLVEMEGVSELLEARLGQLLRRWDGGHDAQERRERNMLLRLAELWHRAPVHDRRSPRVARQRPVEVALGAVAAHQALAEAPFTPAMDRLRACSLHRRMSDAAAPGGQFTDAYREALAHDRRYARTHTRAVQTWRQENESGAGLCLRTRTQQAPRMQVGELMAFRFPEGRHTGWQLGLVRWLRCDPEFLGVGVSALAAGAIPVAVRPVTAPAHAEHLRGFLLPGARGERACSLVVSGEDFDVGATVEVSTHHALQRVRFARLVLATACFAQFAIEEVAGG